MSSDLETYQPDRVGGIVINTGHPTLKELAPCQIWREKDLSVLQKLVTHVESHAASAGNKSAQERRIALYKSDQQQVMT